MFTTVRVAQAYTARAIDTLSVTNSASLADLWTLNMYRRVASQRARPRR